MIRPDELETLAKSEPEVDVVPLIEEIMVWADSLTGDIMDDVVYNTLESVVDIIIDHCC